jgi:hypothetical protein
MPPNAGPRKSMLGHLQAPSFMAESMTFTRAGLLERKSQERSELSGGACLPGFKL